MKDLFVALVIVVIIIFTANYSYQIWRRHIIPTLSTWITFVVGTGLSFSTYVIAANWDIRSGINNTADFAEVLIILVATLCWGKHEMRLRPFEKWYLSGVAAIVFYGFVSGNAWNSNILTQVLITIGYIPTMHNLIQQKKNTESFFPWSCALIASTLSLYPALSEGNKLAVIYSTRAVVSLILLLALMAYYQFFPKKSN
jgi:hypothetical protein